jgi:hypothetical protein
MSKKYKYNKTIAGYHILMILSAADFRFHPDEDLIIRDYLAEEFPFDVNLDKQMEVISGLHPDQWKEHFLKCLQDFHDDSTEKDRKEIIQFSMNLAKADEIITVEENEFLQLLFTEWYPGEEGDA